MKKTIVSVATLTAITGVAATGVSADEYTITSGDTLWGIANEVGTSVAELKADNQITSDLIFPGDVLTFNVEANVEVTEENTSTENASSYIVKSGDTLSAIGAEFSIDYKEIMKWNNLSSDLIFVGQTLTVEAGAEEVAPTPVVEEVVEVEAVEEPVVEEVVEVEAVEEPVVEEVVEVEAVEEPVVEEVVEVVEEPVVEEVVEVEVVEEPVVEEVVEVEVVEEPVVEEVVEVEVVEEPTAEEVAAEQAAADKAAAEQAAADKAAAEQAAADKAAAEQVAAEQAAADKAAAEQAAADKAAAEQAAADKAAAEQAAAERAAEQAAAERAAAEQAAADKAAAEQAAAERAAEQAAADKAAAEQAAAERAAAEQAAAERAAEQVVAEQAVAQPAAATPVQNVSNGKNYYSWGTCAWYVFEKRSSMGLSVGNSWGDAKHWASNAQSAGYSVSNSPSVGAIMQAPAYTNGAYGQGHVAVVERVNGDGSILVSEMQFGGGLGDKNTRTLSASQAANHNFIN